MKININKLQKKYDDAVKNKIDVFTYDGAEILTSYAKYLLEYLNGSIEIRKLLSITNCLNNEQNDE